MIDIKIELTTNKKDKPDINKLGFGQIFTDHMFILDYIEGKGWHDPRIIPYQTLSLDPAAKVFHYGQTVFEGLKAYLTVDKRVLLFRPERNFKRLNASNERLCIPAINEEHALEALKQFITVDREWIPNEPRDFPLYPSIYHWNRSVFRCGFFERFPIYHDYVSSGFLLQRRH